MFSWIKYINEREGLNEKQKRELENYCNSDEFETDTNIIFATEPDVSTKDACIIAIENYIENTFI